VIEPLVIIFVFLALAAIVLWIVEAIGKLVGPKATWVLFLVLVPAGLGLLFAAVEKPETDQINIVLYPVNSVAPWLFCGFTNCNSRFTWRNMSLVCKATKKVKRSLGLCVLVY